MKHAILAAALLLVLSFLAFFRVLEAPFLSDDWCIARSVPRTSLGEIWTRTGPVYEGFGGFYRPFTATTFLLEQRLTGTSSSWNRAVGVALHGLNSFLVLLLSLQFLTHLYKEVPRRLGVSVVAGLLFLVSPSHSETVSWIAARADLLATFFSLLSLILFVPLLDQAGIKHSVASLGLSLLAFLSKESAVALPFAVIAITAASRMHSGKSTPRFAILHCILLVLLLVSFWGVRSWLLGSMMGGYGPQTHGSLSTATAIKSFVAQILRSFLPPLPYGLRDLFRPAMFPLALFVSGAGAVTLLYFMVQAVRKRVTEATTFSLLLFVLVILSLVPVTNIGISLFSTDGERIVYLASVFACTLIATISVSLIANKANRAILIGIVVALYTVALYRSNENWRTAGRLLNTINGQIQSFSNSGPVTIANLPDNYRGAFIYRAYSCVASLHPNTEVLSFHGVRSLDEENYVELQKEDVYQLSLSPDARIIKVNERSNCLQPIQVSEKQIKFKSICPGDLLYFTRGNLAKH